MVVRATSTIRLKGEVGQPVRGGSFIPVQAVREYNCVMISGLRLTKLLYATKGQGSDIMSSPYVILSILTKGSQPYDGLIINN